jgi:hypothetical protein
MSQVSAAEICAFVRALGQDRSASGESILTGNLFLVNLLDSWEDRLVDEQDAVAFLADCLHQWTERTLIGALSAVEAVAALNVKSGVSVPRYLRLCRQADIRQVAHFSTITTYQDFARYICPAEYTRVQPRLLPAAAPESNKDMETLERDIGRITARRGWFDEQAVLGGPQPKPRNCWVSANLFSDDEPTALYDGMESPADRARDELGLVLGKDDRHLVKLSFTAESAAAASSQDMARPTFADGEGPRFRARHPCDRGKAMAQAGWGTAVHLARLPDPQLHPPTGKAVRVSRPLKVAQLVNVKVEYLHRTRIERGTSAKDDDPAFLKLLLDTRSMPAVLEQLCRKITDSPYASTDAS